MELTTTLLKREQAAVYCDLSLSTFLRLADEHNVQAIKYSKKNVRYDKQDLDELKSKLKKQSFKSKQ